MEKPWVLSRNLTGIISKGIMIHIHNLAVTNPSEIQSSNDSIQVEIPYHLSILNGGQVKDNSLWLF